MRLTLPAEPGHAALVAAQSATGVGSPIPEAHKRPATDCRRFFHARVGAPGSMARFLRRAVRGGRKACRSSGRSSNRASSATLFGSQAVDLNQPEETAMRTATAAIPTSLPIASTDLRTIRDEADSLRLTMIAVHSLLTDKAPNRDDLAYAFDWLRQQRRKGRAPDVIEGARATLEDLLTDEDDLNMVTREDLADLFDCMLTQQAEISEGLTALLSEQQARPRPPRPGVSVVDLFTPN